MEGLLGMEDGVGRIAGKGGPTVQKKFFDLNFFFRLR